MVIDVKNGLACSAVVISTGPVRLKNRSKKGDSVVFDHQTYDGTSRVYSQKVQLQKVGQKKLGQGWMTWSWQRLQICNGKTVQ